jgi:CO/xanthine dehydrogenase FAD-binding subunit
VAAYVSYEGGSLSGGRISAAKIILGGIAPSPIEVSDAAYSLIGEQLSEDRIQAAAEAAYVKARPLDNTDFVMNWRKQMARQYTLLALNDVRNQGAYEL